MTEKTDTTAESCHIIDPVAFFVALIGAPLLVAVAGFWALLIPVFALVFGAIPYLALGTPILLIRLARRPARPKDLAGIAMATVLVAGALAAVVCLAAGRTEATGFVAFLTLWGLIFAPLWAACFGWIYLRLARDFFTRPIPD